MANYKISESLDELLKTKEGRTKLAMSLMKPIRDNVFYKTKIFNENPQMINYGIKQIPGGIFSINKPNEKIYYLNKDLKFEKLENIVNNLEIELPDILAKIDVNFCHAMKKSQTFKEKITLQFLNLKNSFIKNVQEVFDSSIEIGPEFNNKYITFVFCHKPECLNMDNPVNRTIGLGIFLPINIIVSETPIDNVIYSETKPVLFQTPENISNTSIEEYNEKFKKLTQSSKGRLKIAADIGKLIKNDCLFIDKIYEKSENSDLEKQKNDSMSLSEIGIALLASSFASAAANSLLNAGEPNLKPIIQGNV